MRVRLGDVCEKGSSNLKQSDVINKNGEYEIYGASGLIGKVDFFHQEKPYIAVVKDGAGIGRTMLLPEKSSVIGTMQYILPNEKVIPKYLYYVIRYMHLEKYFTGATITHIYFKDYKREEFNLCNLSEQEKIVSTLSKIEKTITHRKQQLEKLDLLVKARFVEMFGDPVKNDKRFPTVPGETLFKLSNGKALPNSKRLTEGVPAYGGNGISWYTDEVLCDYDTIIVGRVGFQSGNVHLAKAPLWVTDNAMYISNIDSPKCDIRFLCALMEHIDFTRCQDAGDLKKITQKPFMQMQYLVPPMVLQLQYITFVAQVNKSKLAVQKGLQELETLKNSLMQQYFG